jgi:threonine dehydratase
MTNGTPNGTETANGTNGDEHRPQTPPTRGPVNGAMSLTEYSANPSTPAEVKRNRIKAIVPEEYLLPNGFPDVSDKITRLLLCPLR